MRAETAETAIGTLDEMEADPSITATLGVDVRAMVVTPEQAEEWLTANKLTTQRPISRTNLNKIKDAILAGEFPPVTTIVLYEMDGAIFVEDGQHRLKAVVDTQEPTAFIVVTKRASSREEIDDIYLSLDQGKGRSDSEALYGTGVHEKCHMSYGQMKILIPALKILLTKFTGRSSSSPVTRSRATLKKAVIEYQAEALAYFDAIESGIDLIQRRMKMAPVMAVALVTFRGSPDKAAIFWKRAAEQNCLTAFSGEWWLDKVLQELDVRGGVDVASRRIASCWNAFMVGKTISHPRAVRKARIVIKGTRYTCYRTPDAM